MRQAPDGTVLLRHLHEHPGDRTFTFMDHAQGPPELDRRALGEASGASCDTSRLFLAMGC